MTMKELTNSTKVAVVGLGYVGLPLACELAAKYPVLGFDINKIRISELSGGHDRNLDVSDETLRKCHSIKYSDNESDLGGCDIFIVTAPTPVNSQNQPDLTPILSATRTVGTYLAKGGVVIFESTVYPGATEEDCVPLLEECSGLKFNEDFFVGYSPERINPGDTKNTLTKIIKVTSGSTEAAADVVDALYASIITAGTHRASSIRVAEAAKVIENTQRDLNIALVNELAVLFSKLDINTDEVLAAAGTKWNFLPFKPGLVGGHCIGVDPYYLTFKAQQVGYHPDVILAGRRINDSMGEFVANQVVKLMMERRIHILDSRVLILGLTFKENCPDTRNSRVPDIVKSLNEYHAHVDVFDPWVSDLEEPKIPESNVNINLIKNVPENTYDAIILAVSHQQFIDFGIEKIKSFGKENNVVYDVKNLFPNSLVDGSL